MTQDRTRAIVEAAEALCEHVKIGLDVKVCEVPRITYTHTLDDLRRLSEAVALPAEPARPSSSADWLLSCAEDALALTATCGADQELLDELRDAVDRYKKGWPSPVAPAWTRTPPSEPGFYWARQMNAPTGFRIGGDEARRPSYVILDIRMVDGQLLAATPRGLETVESLAAIDNGMEVEWWPVPIQPPEET